METKQRLQKFYEKISDDLDRTVEFWMKHSIDEECGGYFQCLDTEGHLYDTTKYSWLLCRQVWMLARLYQDVPRFHQQNILEAVIKGAEFVFKHVKDQTTNRCCLSMTREGAPLKMQRTIFSESFYMMAMSETGRVTGEDKYKKEAMSMMKQIVHWVKVDGSGYLGDKIIPPGAPCSSLAVPMVMLMLIGQLEASDPAHGDSFSELAEWCVLEAAKHVQRKGEVVLETVTADGEEVKGSGGRLMNPGHAIEAGWFILERAIKGDKDQLKQLAISAFIEAPFKKGWDAEQGGLFQFVDVDDQPPLQIDWDKKLWWPHAEAMIAFLMTYRETKNDSHLEKFAQVFDYTYRNLVDTKHGEWFGYLNRDGKVSIHAKGGPWKGCFHVPRALMICEQILKELLQTPGE